MINLSDKGIVLLSPRGITKRRYIIILKNYLNNNKTTFILICLLGYCSSLVLNTYIVIGRLLGLSIPVVLYSLVDNKSQFNRNFIIGFLVWAQIHIPIFTMTYNVMVNINSSQNQTIQYKFKNSNEAPKGQLVPKGTKMRDRNMKNAYWFKGRSALAFAMPNSDYDSNFSSSIPPESLINNENSTPENRTNQSTPENKANGLSKKDKFKKTVDAFLFSLKKPLNVVLFGTGFGITWNGVSRISPEVFTQFISNFSSENFFKSNTKTMEGSPNYHFRSPNLDLKQSVNIDSDSVYGIFQVVGGVYLMVRSILPLEYQASLRVILVTGVASVTTLGCTSQTKLGQISLIVNFHLVNLINMIAQRSHPSPSIQNNVYQIQQQLNALSQYVKTLEQGNVRLFDLSAEDIKRIENKFSTYVIKTLEESAPR